MQHPTIGRSILVLWVLAAFFVLAGYALVLEPGTAFPDTYLTQFAKTGIVPMVILVLQDTCDWIARITWKQIS